MIMTCNVKETQTMMKIKSDGQQWKGNESGRKYNNNDKQTKWKNGNMPWMIWKDKDTEM